MAESSASPAPPPSPIPTVPKEPGELENVCVEGTGFDALPAYLPGKGKRHKAVLLRYNTEPDDAQLIKAIRPALAR